MLSASLNKTFPSIASEPLNVSHSHTSDIDLTIDKIALNVLLNNKNVQLLNRLNINYCVLWMFMFC